MDWKEFLLISTQISIVTFCIVGIITSIVFTIAGLVFIKTINNAKNFMEYKASQFEEFSSNLSSNLQNFSSVASPVANFTGIALSLFGLKKSTSIIDKILKSLKKRK